MTQAMVDMSMQWALLALGCGADVHWDMSDLLEANATLCDLLGMQRQTDGHPPTLCAHANAHWYGSQRLCCASGGDEADGLHAG